MTNVIVAHPHENLRKLVFDDRVLSSHLAADATFADLALMPAMPEIDRHDEPRLISVTLCDDDTP